MADPKEITNKKLQGKVAIVTGGASGIGEATARKFALHGVRAVVIADVQDEKGQNVAASIGSDRSIYIHCDVTDEDQVKSLIESTVRIYGRLDIMFSNAGIGSAGEQTVLELDLAMYDRVMAVNARGMAASFADYTMSKHAVLGLMRSASVQLSAYGIRVNCVSPGSVTTPLLRSSFKAGAVAEEEDVGRLVESSLRLKVGKTISVENIADSVVFLASDDSEFVTGHNLVVDGGFISRIT
ncbi:PREDICTED: short-chain [Prunus dulcis]|uniref:PREDICTED: short-chain n=1 Tax=Prunus dulcis TaxID=3755 RepID=A0A5E4F4H3_PRUDU|nr:PREDICTED: short-chain [Prunus dulcis]